MRISALGSIAGMAALLSFPLSAKDEFPNDVAKRDGAVLLKPISPWNIDYGESRCRLGRLFGSQTERHAIFFEQGSPSRSFTLTAGGPKLKRLSRAGHIDIGMESDEPMARYERVARAELGEFGPAVIMQRLVIHDGPVDDQPTYAEESGSEERERRPRLRLDESEAEAINRIVLKRGKRVVSFETGNMKAPFEALNECARNLLYIWGLDAETHDLYTPVSWINARTVVKRIQGRYPSTALRKGEQGIFRMRVIVEPDGSVSGCHIDNATKTEKLQSPACQEMQRAKFLPALDAQGQPMRSYYMTSITYVASGG